MNHEVTPILKTWQFFLSCRRILGETFLTTLFNRGPRQIYRWSADPDFTSPEGTERNPLDRLNAIFERLSERGRIDVALAALSILSGTINCDVIPSLPVIPDKSTIEAEMLDDYPALVKFHEAIRTRKSEDAVKHWCNEAKRELDETLHKYIRK